MQPLLELLNKSSDFLSGKEVENARLNAELIFAEVFDCKRLDLYLMFERPVRDEEADRLRKLIVRRGKREPLQYVLGHTEFYHLKLNCDQRALIPRPETEELAARLVMRCRDTMPSAILDLGTGSGALALALGQAFPESMVTALDASAEALALATENARLNNLDDRVRFIRSDWFSEITDQKFDLIVSNPPYLTEAEWECAEPEVKDHEPHPALVGQGTDGAEDLIQIIKEAPAYLNEEGLLALETGIAQHSTLSDVARLQDYMKFDSEVDSSKRPRYFFATR